MLPIHECWRVFWSPLLSLSCLCPNIRINVLAFLFPLRLLIQWDLLDSCWRPSDAPATFGRDDRSNLRIVHLTIWTVISKNPLECQLSRIKGIQALICWAILLKVAAVLPVLSRDGPASNLTFWHYFLPLKFLSSNTYIVLYPIWGISLANSEKFFSSFQILSSNSQGQGWGRQGRESQVFKKIFPNSLAAREMQINAEMPHLCM